MVLRFRGRYDSGPNIVDGVSFPTGLTAQAGLTVANVASILPTDIGTYSPNWVVLSVGTANSGAESAGDVAAEVMSLIGDCFTASGTVKILALGMTMKPDTDSDGSVMSARQSALASLVAAHANYNTRLFWYDRVAHWLLVPDYKTSMYGGGNHPTDTGYNYDAVGIWSAMSPLVSDNDIVIWAGDSQILGTGSTDLGGPRTRVFRLALNPVRTVSTRDLNPPRSGAVEFARQ